MPDKAYRQSRRTNQAFGGLANQARVGMHATALVRPLPHVDFEQGCITNVALEARISSCNTTISSRLQFHHARFSLCWAGWYKGNSPKEILMLTRQVRLVVPPKLKRAEVEFELWKNCHVTTVSGTSKRDNQS